jgi:hypothetical protein
MKTPTRNEQFEALTADIRGYLPRAYLTGILASYAINALIIGFFMMPIVSKMFSPGLAPWIVWPGSVVIQYFRFLIVFTDQLFPSGPSSRWIIQAVALTMTIWGVAEAWHLTRAFELPGNEFWGVFGFTASIIIAGYIMEVNFVAKTNQLTLQQNQQFEQVGQVELEGQQIPVLKQKEEPRTTAEPEPAKKEEPEKKSEALFDPINPDEWTGMPIPISLHQGYEGV